jgi:hypothetical protein
MIKGSTIKISIYIFLIGVLFSTSLFSQGLVVSKLSYNPVLNPNKKNIKQSSFLRSASFADTLVLGVKGIIEDFSYSGPYPDTSLWLDDQVYINRGMCISPPSIGVATFDGLGANGYPYNFLAGTVSNPGDTLTSKPIDLNYVVTDSVYLSFYYQTQGFGNDPQIDDSLVLEFKAPGNLLWNHIWSKEGSKPTAVDTGFKLVMIPIINPAYLKKGFQFRFRNYASINADADQWNIDYIYLNTVRTASDTIFADVAWVYDGTSLLKNYTAMPWKQYSSSELRTKVNNLIRNNDNSTGSRKVDYDYQTLNLTTNTILDQFNGASNIYPFSKNKIYSDCNFPQGCINTVSIDVSKFPNSLAGSTQLAIKHYYASSDYLPQNDTILAICNLLNYFAYDDGTAEQEVGLNRIDGKLAIQFKLNVADTLGAVDIYFNPFITNAELYGFFLNVWNDNGGTPGNPIYTSPSILSPIYKKEGQNVFARYYLNSGSPLLSPGTYYVGFTQKTNELINVGLDKNNNSQTKTFLNVGDGHGWQTSTETGALMMRPIMGNVVNPVGINKYEVFDDAMQIYPNPATDKLYIRSKVWTNKINFQIMDVFGKIILEGNSEVSDFIDISGISEGLYFVKVTFGTEVTTNKFIKIN